MTLALTRWEKLLRLFTPQDSEWMRQAACKDSDPTLFDANETPRRQPAEALKICRRCPVKEPCLQWALADPYSEGVYGGVHLVSRWGSNRATYNRQRRQLEGVSG